KKQDSKKAAFCRRLVFMSPYQRPCIVVSQLVQGNRANVVGCARASVVDAKGLSSSLVRAKALRSSA
ncbi:MAG: hypothetical protein ACKPKO_30020, partial [Candidatus Fonsibacter sp.]